MKKIFLLLLWLTLLPLAGWAQDATLTIGGQNGSYQNALSVTYKGAALDVTVRYNNQNYTQGVWQYSQTGTSNWQDTNASSIKNVGYYRVRRTNNYWTYAYLHVTPATLTVTAGAASKTYGQADADATFEYSLSGVYNNEVSKTNITGLRIATRTNGNNVGNHEYILTGGSLPNSAPYNNYTLAYAAGTLTINAKSLTLVCGNEEKVYGTADADAFTIGIPSGIETGDQVTISNVVYQRVDPGEDVSATPYGYTATSATLSNNNYEIGGFTPGTLKITPKALTLTAGAASKTYGQADADATFDYTVTGMAFSDAAPDVTGLSIETRTDVGENVGTYSYNLTGGVSANANYTIGTYVPGTLTINKKAITVKPIDLTKTQGVEDAIFVASNDFLFRVNGMVSWDLPYDAKAVVENVGISRTANEAVGTWEYWLGLNNAALGTNYANNYTLDKANSNESANLTIASASDIIVTLGNITKVYGEDDPANWTESASVNLGNNGNSITANEVLTKLTFKRIDDGQKVGMYRYTAEKDPAYTEKNIVVSNTGWLDIMPRDIAQATIATIADQDYTGANVVLTPDENLIVTDDKTITTADWTASYADNLNPGQATVTLTGQGNYTGTLSANFNIVLDLAQTTINLVNTPDGGYVYSGSAFEPAVTSVKFGDNVVDASLYSVSWEDNIDASAAAKVNIAANSQYAKNANSTTFTIDPKPIADQDVVATVTKATYSGGILPSDLAYSLTYVNLTLDGDDYELVPDAEQVYNAGDATFTVAGKGNYTGQKVIEFTVAKRSLGNSANRAISYNDNGKVYDAEPYDAQYVITSKLAGNTDAELVEGVDYTVQYIVNGTATDEVPVNVSQFTIKFTGKGNWNGTSETSKTMAITAKPITITAVDVTAAYGTDVVIEEVEDYSEELCGEDALEGDLVLKVKDAEDNEVAAPYNVGTYVIEPSGLSNANYDITFANGTLEITAGQVAADIAAEAIYGSLPTFTLTATDGLSPDETATFNAQQQPATITVKKDGAAIEGFSEIAPDADALKTLAVGSYKLDATVDLPNYTVVVAEGDLTIAPKSIAAEGITITVTEPDGGFVYQNAAYEPAITVADANATITEDDYDVAYADNINAGTATITITGKGNYDAETTATQTFEIAKKTGVTITADNTDWTYGAEEPAYQVTTEGLAEGETLAVGETLAGIDGTLKVKRTSNNSTGSHTGALVPYFADADGNEIANAVADNYEFTLVAGNLTVGAAGAVIALKEDVVGTYGADPATFIAAVMNGKANYVAVEGITDAEIASGAVNLTNVEFAIDADEYQVGETYTFTLTGATSTNYTVTISDGTYKVNPAAITIAAVDQTIDWSADPDAAPDTDVTTATEIKAGALQYNDAITDLIASVDIDASPKVGDNVIDLTKTDNANYEITIIKGNLEVIPAPAIVLRDDDPNVYSTIQSYDGKSVPVKINFSNRNGKTLGGDRNWEADFWHTLVLPFDITVSDISRAFGYAIVNEINPEKTVVDGTGSKFYGKLILRGTESTDGAYIPANTPIMVKVDTDVDSNVDYDFGTRTIVAPTTATSSVDAGSNAYFTGTYETKNVTKADDAAIWFMLGNYFQWAYITTTSSASWDITPFSAYIDMSRLPASARRITFYAEEANGNVSAINSISVDDIKSKTVEGVYNLNGMKMDGVPAQKGVYIHNGKKIVVK
jgi:hypothetical protein